MPKLLPPLKMLYVSISPYLGTQLHIKSQNVYTVAQLIFWLL